MRLYILLFVDLSLSLADVELEQDPLKSSLESLLSSVLPEISSCLVLVYPASSQGSYLDLIKPQHGLRVSMDSPDLQPALVASYRMKCNGYVTDSDTSWKMLTALGEARLEAMERHTPKVLILPSMNLSSGTGCEVMRHHEADYIPDILLVTRDDSSSSKGSNFDLSLYTNKYVPNIDNASGNCLLYGKWPSNISIFYPDKIKNLQGKEIIIFSVEYPPYTMLQPTFDGMEARFAREFCRKYNCTIRIITDDDLWGEIFGNGTGIGMSGAVYMDRADWGMGAFGAWLDEHTYVEYSYPYLATKVAILVPKPSQLPEWRIPILPFTGTMWALQVLSIVVAATMLALVNRVADIFSTGIGGEFSTFGGIALRSLAMALLQPPPDRLPSASPLRRFFTIFELLFFFFTTIYSGALSAVLTVPLYYPPIDTPQDLYAAGIPWLADHEAWIYSIKEATEPYLKGLVGRFQSHETEELIRLSNKGGYAFSVEIMAGGHVAQMDHLSGEMILGLHVMKNELYTTSLVFLLRKGSPYTEKMNELLARCLDTGLFLLWETDVTLTHLSSRLQTALKISEGSRVEVESEPTTLRIVHTQGAFYMLAMGLVLSTAFFCFEKFNHGKKKSSRGSESSKLTESYSGDDVGSLSVEDGEDKSQMLKVVEPGYGC